MKMAVVKVKIAIRTCGNRSDKLLYILKAAKDRQGDAGNELIEFRITGRDYTEDYKK